MDYPPLSRSFVVLSRQIELNKAGFYEGKAPGELDKLPKGDEIQPLFTARGKTFNSQKAAAEWLADQERLEAAHEFMEMVPWMEEENRAHRLLAIRELGALIQVHPAEMAKAAEIRCSPEAFTAFVDELVLLRDGGF